MNKLLSLLRIRAVAVLAYLGDAAHRRFVTALVAWLIVHFVGREIAPDVIDSAVEAAVTALAAAWSSSTPKVDRDDDDGKEER